MTKRYLQNCLEYWSSVISAEKVCSTDFISNSHNLIVIKAKEWSDSAVSCASECPGWEINVLVWIFRRNGKIEDWRITSPCFRLRCFHCFAVFGVFWVFCSFHFSRFSPFFTSYWLLAKQIHDIHRRLSSTEIACRKIASQENETFHSIIFHSMFTILLVACSSDWLTGIIFEFGATFLQPMNIGPGIRVRRIKVQRSVVLPQWSASLIKDYPKILHLHLLHIFDGHLPTSFSLPEDE